jgi:hypothetical protein
MLQFAAAGPALSADDDINVLLGKATGASDFCISVDRQGKSQYKKLPKLAVPTASRKEFRLAKKTAEFKAARNEAKATLAAIPGDESVKVCALWKDLT